MCKCLGRSTGARHICLVLSYVAARGPEEGVCTLYPPSAPLPSDFSATQQGVVYLHPVAAGQRPRRPWWQPSSMVSAHPVTKARDVIKLASLRGRTLFCTLTADLDRASKAPITAAFFLSQASCSGVSPHCSQC